MLMEPRADLWHHLCTHDTPRTLHDLRLAYPILAVPLHSRYSNPLESVSL